MKTPEQYKKKKAQAQHVTVQVQEVDSVRISVEKASEHVVLPGDYVATSSQAVILCVGMTVMMQPTIMVQNAAIWMPRMGVG